MPCKVSFSILDLFTYFIYLFTPFLFYSNLIYTHFDCFSVIFLSLIYKTKCIIKIIKTFLAYIFTLIKIPEIIMINFFGLILIFHYAFHQQVYQICLFVFKIFLSILIICFNKCIRLN